MKLKLIAVISVTFILAACNSGAEQQKQSEDLSDSIVPAADSSLQDENEEVSYKLPSALQIAYVFKKSGSAFVPSLLNDASSVNKYNTSTYKRATNFGIYSSDLSYCLFNKKYQESKNYLKACKEVGSFLGLNQAFESDNMAQRFDKNISNEDSLVKIVSSVQMKTDLLFEQNKQKYIMVIAFAGAWTESAYIASELYKKDKNPKVLASLMEQLLLAETILKALKANEKAEAEIPALISEIEKINTQFNAIAAVKAAKETDEELNSDALKVSEQEFNAINASLSGLRKSMVN